MRIFAKIKNKNMIASYDLGVFRRVLHVAVSPTLEELQERFRFALNSDDCEDKYAELDKSVYNSLLKGHEAFVIRVVDKKDNLYGYLVHLDGNGCGNMSDFIDTITHESGHVMDDIFYDSKIKKIDTEISSLVLGYISGKVYKTFEEWKKKSE